MNAPVAPGDLLAGKYRVERVLGKGGMGMVVAAMHLALEKRVALKFLLPEVAQNQELVARFAREAKAASRIESEHCARVLDTGQLESGAPFMVMEYLEGSDLAQLVKQQGALAPQDAIEYVLQACEALAEAHVAGIVHRDLKPANLFLIRRADGSPCIKVLDFGISKIALASDQGQGMTQTSALMGSPNYMAPEQLKSARNVDARADIWSLGIILQELLTGEVAFKADTVPELYISILQSPPIPLRSRRPDAPAAMEAIITRCLEKDPGRRFASVGELAQALGEFAPPRARLSIDRITRIVGTPARGGGAAPTVTGPPGSGTAPMPPQPTYGPSPAAYHGGVSQLGGAPGAYGPGPYGPPLGPGMVPPTLGPQYGQPYGGGPPPQPSPAMPTAQVALMVLIAVLVLGGGSCMMCLCVGAANQQGNKGHRGEVSPVEQGAALGAFQRPAGWTTVSRGARSRLPPAPYTAWDGAGQARLVLVRRSSRNTRGAGDDLGLGSAS
jgi:serine/threonine-protein kinase